MPDVKAKLLPTCSALLTAVVLLLHVASWPACAVTVGANTPGLYRNYYNSGFSRTPITTMPNYASMTPANSDFVNGTTGDFKDPQQNKSNTYCGGVYQGYLRTTMPTATYIVGIQSKEGFSVTVDGNTASSNSKLEECICQGQPQYYICCKHCLNYVAPSTLQVAQGVQCWVHAFLYQLVGIASQARAVGVSSQVDQNRV